MNRNALPACNGPLRTALAPKAYRLGLSTLQPIAHEPGSIADRVAESRNFLTSPTCLQLALATAAAGAAGQTLQDLLEVLGMTEKSQLREIADTLAVGSRLVSTACRAVARRDLTFERGFAATMATLGGTMHRLDFTNTAKAQEKLDNWVYRNTKGLIPRSGITVTPTIDMVLQSALALVAPWAEPFRVEDTEDDEFFLMSGERQPCRMMYTSRNLPYGEYEGWRATTLPYDGGLTCDIIVPPDGTSPLDATPGLLLGLLQEMLESSRLPLEVKLPKVSTSSSESLRTALTRMGLGSLFDNADFSAMSPEVSGISDCVQQVLLEVDERETKAAATVEMVMLACAHGGARTPRPPLVCDHPFLLVVRDETTDVPVYMGAIHHPSQPSSAS